MRLQHSTTFNHHLISRRWYCNWGTKVLQRHSTAVGLRSNLGLWSRFFFPSSSGWWYAWEKKGVASAKEQTHPKLGPVRVELRNLKPLLDQFRKLLFEEMLPSLQQEQGRKQQGINSVPPEKSLKSRSCFYNLAIRHGKSMHIPNVYVINYALICTVSNFLSTFNICVFPYPCCCTRWRNL